MDHHHQAPRPPTEQPRCGQKRQGMFRKWSIGINGFNMNGDILSTPGCCSSRVFLNARSHWARKPARFGAKSQAIYNGSSQLDLISSSSICSVSTPSVIKQPPPQTWICRNFCSWINHDWPVLMQLDVTVNWQPSWQTSRQGTSLEAAPVTTRETRMWHRRQGRQLPSRGAHE